MINGATTAIIPSQTSISKDIGLRGFGTSTTDRASSSEAFSIRLSSEAQAFLQQNLQSVQQPAELTEANSQSTQLVASDDVEVSAAPAGRAAAPPPPPPANVALDELFDELDTNEDGVVDVTELVAGIAKEEEEEAQVFGTGDSAYSYQAAKAIGAYNNALVL